MAREAEAGCGFDAGREGRSGGERRAEGKRRVGWWWWWWRFVILICYVVLRRTAFWCENVSNDRLPWYAPMPEWPTPPNGKASFDACTSTSFSTNAPARRDDDDGDGDDDDDDDDDGDDDDDDGDDDGGDDDDDEDEHEDGGGGGGGDDDGDDDDDDIDDGDGDAHAAGQGWRHTSLALSREHSLRVRRVVGRRAPSLDHSRSLPPRTTDARGLAPCSGARGTPTRRVYIHPHLTWCPSASSRRSVGPGGTPSRERGKRGAGHGARVGGRRGRPEPLSL